MDSMLILHVRKWMFAEFLRLAWTADKQVIADTIAQIVQLQHTLIHELDGKPLVLARGIPAADEILLLLNHAPGNPIQPGGDPAVCPFTESADAECGDCKTNRQP